RRLTRKGALLFLAGPLVLAAVVLAFAVPALHLWPLVVVASCLAAAGLVALGVRLRYRRPQPPLWRAPAYAWKRLVPGLHAARFEREDATFLAGLALTTIAHEAVGTAAGALTRVLPVTEKAALAGQGAVEYFADLRRLVITEAVAAGRDPIPLV